MSTRYNKSPYTARTMLRCSPLRRVTFKQIDSTVKKEVHQLCTIKQGTSFFRDTSPSAVASFSWKPMIAELRMHAPVLYSIVKAAIHSSKSKQPPEPRAIGTTAAVLLKWRCTHMSKLQAVISTMLYVGHCSKQV